MPLTGQHVRSSLGQIRPERSVQPTPTGATGHLPIRNPRNERLTGVGMAQKRVRQPAVGNGLLGDVMRLSNARGDGGGPRKLV
jgi:hypothetical protein